MLEFPKKSKIEGFPVNDVETGAPLAFMAAKLLAKKDSKVLTMLGAGPIAKACFRAIMTNYMDPCTNGRTFHLCTRNKRCDAKSFDGNIFNVHFMV